MKDQLNYLLFSFLFLSVTACNQQSSTSSSPKKAHALTQYSKETMIIQTQYGPIHIKFFPQAAPKTVARISELIKRGFYDGLTFHRVIKNFVVQGGDPKGNGTGGSGQNIPAEFNSIPHKKGILSMARAQNPDSADSQFFICLNTLPHLDNQYTVFGEVIKGMDAVVKIQQGDKMKQVTLQ